MINLKRNVLWIVVLSLLGIFGIATTFAAWRSYLQYCSGSVYDPVCSGGYQDDIDAAMDRANEFMREIRSYSSSEQQDILNTLIRRLALYHATVDNSYDQIIASYYHDYFKAERDGESQESVDTIIARLIWSSTNRSSSSMRSSTRRVNNTPDDGRFTSIRPWRSWTTIRNDRISARGELNLQIVVQERDEILQDTDVRIVAELFNRNRLVDTVAANERGSYRSLVLSDQFDRVDEMKLYLLCQECDRGTQYHWRLFRDRRVLDTEEFDVSITRTSRYDRYYDRDRSDNNDYDLEIRSLEYQYDGNGREVHVNLTTVVRNIWERDNELEKLEYKVEIDGRRVSSSRYDINHRRTDCDDRSVDRNDTRNLTIDEDDECEITIEFVFDQDTVEDERLEIFVEVIAQRDDNIRNNEDDVSFFVE